MIRWALNLPFKLILSFLRLISASSRHRRLKSPDDAAAQYITNLEQQHGTSHIPLYRHSYRKAVDEAKKQLRFLMVILTSEMHDDTPAMQRLICDDTLRSYVLDNDLLVWAGNVAELEAFRVGSALGVSRYPFIGILVYNTLPEGSAMMMTCVSKLEGVPSAIELMTHLQESIDKYGPTLISLKADRREQTYAREIREEQDSAYEVSLRKDREKAEARRREAAELEQREQEARTRMNHVTTWRQWKKNTLPDEPASGVKSVARISFRMPDGTRCIRKFSAETLVDDIFAWVDLQLHPVAASDPSIVNAPEGYVHEYDFTVAVPMPRIVLTSGTRETISERREICPSGSLIVEMIDSE